MPEDEARHAKALVLGEADEPHVAHKPRPHAVVVLVGDVDADVVHSRRVFDELGVFGTDRDDPRRVKTQEHSPHEPSHLLGVPLFAVEALDEATHAFAAARVFVRARAETAALEIVDELSVLQVLHRRRHAVDAERLQDRHENDAAREHDLRPRGRHARQSRTFLDRHRGEFGDDAHERVELRLAPLGRFDDGAGFGKARHGGEVDERLRRAAASEDALEFRLDGKRRRIARAAAHEVAHFAKPLLRDASGLVAGHGVREEHAPHVGALHHVDVTARRDGNLRASAPDVDETDGIGNAQKAREDPEPNEARLFHARDHGDLDARVLTGELEKFVAVLGVAQGRRADGPDFGDAVRGADFHEGLEGLHRAVHSLGLQNAGFEGTFAEADHRLDAVEHRSVAVFGDRGHRQTAGVAPEVDESHAPLARREHLRFIHFLTPLRWNSAFWLSKTASPFLGRTRVYLPSASSDQAPRVSAS